MPEHGSIYWSWYWDIANSVGRISSGVCSPIPPSDYVAWAQMSETIVRPFEFMILKEMDRAFVSETQSEINDFHLRQQEKLNKPTPNKRKR